MLTDVRYAIRALRGAPAFTVVAVSTLALGIAVNTIAFTLLNSLALRPMPVRDGGRLVRIYPVDQKGRRSNLFSFPDYLSLREQSRSLDGLVAYIPAAVTLGRDGTSEPVRDGLAYAVSTTYFPVLDIRPALGRTFSVEEEAAPDAKVAIISYSMWQRRHGGRADVLGKTVTINGRAFQIVGVGPQRFMGTEPLSTDVWVPLGAQPILVGENRLQDRANTWLLVLGRLPERGSMATVESDLSVIASRLAAAYPEPDRAVRVAVAPGTFFTIDGQLRPVIGLLLGTVALVLIIACANLANLSLARALSGRRDVATRLALGASRWQVVRLRLMESLIVAACGGAAGLLTSAWTLRLLTPIGLSMLPETWAAVVLDLSPDLRVFLYTTLLSTIAGLAFGLAPALQTSTPGLASALRGDATILGERVSRANLRSALVVLQIATCLMLLVAAALAARSLRRTEALDLGFRANGVLYTTVDLRRNGYSRPEISAFHERLIQRIEAIPGTASIALTSHVPLSDGVVRKPVGLDGRQASAVTLVNEISPEYFRTLGIPIVVGRTFTPEEAASVAPVALISEGLARRFWGSPSDPADRLQQAATAIGKRLRIKDAAMPHTIVGVARDAADVAIWREKELAIYVPISPAGDRNLHLLVHTSVPDLMAAELNHKAAELDPDVRFTTSRLDDVLRLWILPSKIAAIAALVLGLLALAVASLGIFGVMTCAVTERTREIGIRVALGATASEVTGTIMRHGSGLIAVGTAFGLLGSIATTGLVTRWLSGVASIDPVALATASAFLAAVASAACYFPARRAARVDPIVALRDG
jgi:putative ABC transport system permease protein